MAYARHKRRGIRKSAGLLRICLAAAFLLLLGSPALADHSLGRPCVVCHTLRSTNVVTGSRNVLTRQVDDSLYNFDWYCGTPPSSSWIPSAATQPLDCGFCHDKDVGLEISESKRGTQQGSAHPVQVMGDHKPDPRVSNPIPSDRRILCNDCHDGTVASSGGRIAPATPCSKTDTDGYPNHINAVKGGLPPGFNDLTNNPPRLTAKYLPGEVNWSGTLSASNLLCLICHDGSALTDPPYSTNIADTHDIEADYNAVNGGHNIPSMGTYGTAKLACYHCHDPHAATSATTGNNKALIINYYNTGDVHPMASLAGMSNAEFNGFSMGSVEYNGTSNDKALCEGCHNGTTKVEGKIVGAWNVAANIKFDFHQDVHTTAANCLTRLGGCHVSVHNTNIYNCTGCHTTVAAEFDKANGVLSRHDIPLGDGSTAAANGCLNCHDAANDGNGATKIRVAYGGTRYTRPAMDVRQSLTGYDNFCLDCHDGSGTSFTVGSTTYAPPQVNRYFKTEGHGATANFPSGNVAANVPCIECHLYHGSTSYKLLPGNVPTTNGRGNVIKGATGATTVGSKFPIGDLRDSTKIDYRDYSVSANNSRLPDDSRRAWKFADYTASWDTYYGNANNPSGTVVFFGTSGDMLPNSKSPDEAACGKNAETSPKIGFCDVCHFYNDATDGTRLNGTDGTMGWVYTHEGYFTTPTAATNCAGKEYDSKRNNHKDCTECHDPHGSGSSAGGAPNLYMIRGKIIHGNNASWSKDDVVFTALTGCDSFDEDEVVCGGGTDRDDICATCHTDPTLKYHKADGTAPSHNEGGNCAARCHNHGWGATRGVSTTNVAGLGFPNSGDCTACHGYPPEPTGITTPPKENYGGGGGVHLPHIAFLEAKTGASRANYPTLELCGPCHGQGAYAAGHLDSGESGGSWAITSRAFINIGDRSQAVHWGGSATYGGIALPTVPPGGVMSDANSRCASLICHGYASAAENLTWFNSTRAALDTTGNVNDGNVRNRTCEGCHDETPAKLEIYNAANSLVYSATANDAAANYYATISGYGRGGHGDPKIQDEDPFKNSDPSHSTRTASQDGIDCTACHAQASAHFPAASANLHRLTNTNIEDGSISGLCNECHPRDKYPGPITSTVVHHPSYRYLKPGTGTVDVIPVSGTKITVNVTDSTTWSEMPPTGSKHYEQNAYGAGGTASVNGGGTFTFSANPDKFVDWWGGNPGGTLISPPPRPDFRNGALGSPAATLPLERYIYNSGTSNKVMCVTCHNPHGTDLFVFVPSVPSMLTSIPDNNMLRLRDEDNTLCHACHPDD